MTKHCSGCQLLLPESKFPFRDRKNGKRASRCKLCLRNYVADRRGLIFQKKKCSRCGEQKAETDFPWKKFGERRCAHCKTCQRWSAKSAYERLTVDQRRLYAIRAHERKTMVRDENKERIRDYLITHPCIDCGETNLVLLEFDHVRDVKSGTICDMLRKGLSWTRIKAEIGKCDVRCVKCHRIRTASQFGWWKVVVG